MSGTTATVLEATERTAFGKKTRALRRSGQTPFNIYGANVESRALQADTAELINTVRQAGRTKKVVVRVDKDEVETLIRAVDLHPVSGKLRHVDLMRVTEDLVTTVAVPVKLIRVSEAVVTRGSSYNIVQVLHRITLKGKIDSLPALIEVDCSQLAKPSQKIHVADLELPQGVVTTDPRELQVISIQMSRAARAADEPSASAEEEEEPVEESET